MRRWVETHGGSGGGGSDPALAGRVTAAEADIDALQAADVAFAAADSSLDTRLDTAEAALVSLDSRVDTLEADPGYTAPTRTTALATTSSLANGASESLTATLAKGYRLYSISTSRPARVRVYTTTAARTADAARTAAEDPAADAGVVLDYVTTDTSVHSLSPMVDGASLEASPSSSIPLSVTNNGTTGTVTVTLVWIQTEA